MYLRYASAIAHPCLMRAMARQYHKSRYLPHVPASIISQGIQISREELPVCNPATGEQLSVIEIPTNDEVRRTIEMAHELVHDKESPWRRTTALQRSKFLSALARTLEERIPEMAHIEVLQTGRTIREMRAQLGRLPEWLDYFAALLRTKEDVVAPTQGKLLNYIQRIPLGVVAQITPFNHPLLIAIKKIAPALAAGNTVIVKPSEHAPITVLEFAAMAEEVGIPSGVLSVLPGYGRNTGKEIVSHPLVRKVDITAGTNTGRELGSIVGPNLASYTAELGGKAPIVVFNDADIEAAVNGAAFASFIASGQTCVSGTRLIIQNGIYDQFMARFLDKVDSITKRMGNPSNPKSTMGSVISLRHLERIEAIVNRRAPNTQILAGGKRMLGTSSLDGFSFTQGSFFPPTVIADVDIQDELWREEVFGPVVVVKSFEDEAEGIKLANASQYGLGAGIWTKDLSRAHRLAADIDAGLVWVNTHHRNDPSSPWGGMKESGIGRENGMEALMAYSQSKSTIVNIAPPEEYRSTDDWFAEEGRARYG